ncbi:MAG: NADPH-dependent FMN reductase [Bdellovibrio sp.]
MTTKKVAVIVGSLRKESYNRKMAKALLKFAPSSLKLEIIEIDGLPLYNQDFDDEKRPPESWQKFRQKISEYDGLLFVTPEYNRSIPGVLKNALDVGSRPYGKNVWAQKPAGIISVSPGAIGGFGANHHLRQCMVFLDVPVMQQPEAYIGNASKLFDQENNIVEKSVEDYMKKFMASLDQWMERTLPKKPDKETQDRATKSSDASL